MKFIADLHVHSHFSRATAKNLDLENMYIAAQLKGITVVGTGDFTHPGWFSEIKEKLVPAEEGLFKIKDDIAKHCDKKVPISCRGMVRFILGSEISSIYKKKNKTRKIHNLVFLPELELAEKFSATLGKIGNIVSDGRPILGLDARDLLEILLETSSQSFLIPAHIWTPWFSLLGSKSGFDSIEECFEDLVKYIFAVETGLSSDPPMNWRVSGLDGLTLISNSDAHSPLKLGREANIFNTDLTYPSIKSALKTGDAEHFLGTFEFYPEEGKYHLDGHRKCNMRLWPEKTRSLSGDCPVCGKPLTLGVLYRVEQLADRADGVRPEKNHPFQNLIPLVEILSEVLSVGSGSKKVMNNYLYLLERLGPEFDILNSLDAKEIDAAGVPLLGEAIERMRRNEVETMPGYDGEFGTIKVFVPGEMGALLGQKNLFKPPALKSEKKGKKPTKKSILPSAHRQQNKPVYNKTRQRFKNKVARSPRPGVHNRLNLGEMNPEQQRAIEHRGSPLIIVAGPGTGKTRTLTHRIAHLISKKEVPPQNILAVTFTNQAAQEMRHRLMHLLGSIHHPPAVNTFHGLCFKLLNDYHKKVFGIINDDDRKIVIADAIGRAERDGTTVSIKPQTLIDWIVSAKQQIVGPDDRVDGIDDTEKQVFSKVYKSYQRILSVQNLCDYEDLIFKTVRLFEKDRKFTQNCRERFKYVFVDEYQDLNCGQYCIIKALAPPATTGQNICVIGDPDQSIYGFRGSDSAYFKRFVQDYPDAEVVNLIRNYRSTQTIIDASQQLAPNYNQKAPRARIFSQVDGGKIIRVIEAASDKAEAVVVGKAIEQAVGGVGFYSLDFGLPGPSSSATPRSFSDFAVLYRTAAQGRIFFETFRAAGIPCQVVSRDDIFKTKGVAVLISLLKMVSGVGSLVDFERTTDAVKPGISKESLEIFKQWCYQHDFSISEATTNARKFPVEGLRKSRQRRLNDFLDQLEVIDRQTKNLSTEKKLIFLAHETRLAGTFAKERKSREALGRLIEAARTCDNNSDFFAVMALQTDTDTYAHRAEKVALMTMHAAKGLEFPVVFIAGCEDGFLPFRNTESTLADLEEERRLFYVAMTRAKQELHLSFARRRRIYGKTEKRTLSPFINEIEKHLRKHQTNVSSRQKKKVSAQLKLFS